MLVIIVLKIESLAILDLITVIYFFLLFTTPSPNHHQPPPTTMAMAGLSFKNPAPRPRPKPGALGRQQSEDESNVHREQRQCPLCNDEKRCYLLHYGDDEHFACRDVSGIE